MFFHNIFSNITQRKLSNFVHDPVKRENYVIVPLGMQTLAIHVLHDLIQTNFLCMISVPAVRSSMVNISVQRLVHQLQKKRIILTAKIERQKESVCNDLPFECIGLQSLIINHHGVGSNPGHDVFTSKTLAYRYDLLLANQGSMCAIQ